MVITIVADTFTQYNNGTSISAMRFAKQFVKRGHTVRVVTCGEPTESGFDEELGLHMFYIREHRIPLVTRLAHKQKTLIAKPDLQVLYESIAGADVVHVYQAWPLGACAGRVCRELGVPAIAAFHIQPENITWNLGLRLAKTPAYLAYVAMRALFYRHFAHIHCPSEMIAGQLREHGYKAKLHVISNGVPLDFCPDINVPKFDDGKFHVLSVGRLSPEKRHDVLIKAVALAKNRDKITLHIAGQGPLDKQLRKLSEKLGIPVLFSYHSQKDLIDLMRRSHLYVHPSDIEIEGMGCTEAMGCGLVPVISDSRLSATGQFATCEHSLFKSGDPKALAARLDFWILNPDKLEAAGEAYSQKGREYALDKSAEKMEEAYLEAVSFGVLGGHSPPLR